MGGHSSVSVLEYLRTKYCLHLFPPISLTFLYFIVNINKVIRFHCRWAKRLRVPSWPISHYSIISTVFPAFSAALISGSFSFSILSNSFCLSRDYSFLFCYLNQLCLDLYHADYQLIQ